MMKQKIKNNLLKNPFVYTGNILIETTNRCNYSFLHKQCPASFATEPITMSLKFIENILKELGKYNFSGVIYPFLYSEPLIDPRFYSIVGMIKKYVPLAKIWIYTNGFMVDKIMLEELNDIGLDRINFSVYSPEEERRIRKLILGNRHNLKVVLRAYKRFPFCERMNDKVDWYDNKPLNSTRNCPSPLKFLTIRANGDLVICCHDWKNMHVFGNIYKSSIKEILTSDKAIETYFNLTNGKRNMYYLCARCNKHR